jgi:hypothetical protein
VSDPRDAAELRDALEALADGARDLERRAREAARSAARLAGGGAAPAGAAPADGRNAPPAAPSPSGSDPRTGALLVALTLRGGTLPKAELEALASAFGVSSGELAQLLAGAQAPLTARRGGAVGLTERGVEEAAAWRDTLPPELLRAATTL